jgi:hypothetical protein
VRIPAIPQAESSCTFSLRRGFSSRAHHAPPISLALFSSLVLAPLLAGSILAAQSTPAPAPAVATHQTHKQDAARKPSKRDKAPAQPSAQPTPPPAPPPPDWPANDHPSPASVVWDSHGLLVVASNSSLDQILKEVSLDTGVKVEGMSQDERIFGTYGPGPARDVLSQLLDGSNYDVLMIGDLGKGTPRQVVLTFRSAGVPGTGNAKPGSSGEEDTDEQAQEASEPQPEPIPPDQRQFPPNGAASPMPVRTPQQILDEMQARQRQLQQQQQQNPQN